MKKNILGISAQIEPSQSSGIHSMNMTIMELEKKQEEYGVTVYRKPFNPAPTIHITCQCSTSGPSQGKWYGLHIKCDMLSKSQILRATKIIRKLIGNYDYTGCANCDDLIQRAFELCTHVGHDSRFYDYIAVADAESIKHVQAWHDERGEAGCYVHGYTRFEDPTEVQIQEALKRSFCKDGYVDSLIAWINNGMPYGRVGGGTGNTVDPYPPELFVTFPQTLRHPSKAHAEQLAEAQI